jgi:mRNA-degrading endonuclease toxin of MazEF toxin-antitoxin module
MVADRFVTIGLENLLTFVNEHHWFVNLDPTIGSEIIKIRRCVVINNDAIGILPNKVIVPNHRMG